MEKEIEQQKSIWEETKGKPNQTKTKSVLSLKEGGMKMINIENQQNILLAKSASQLLRASQVNIL